MKKSLVNICCPCLYLTIACLLSTIISFSQSANSREDLAIRTLVTHFYEGWNSHDVEKMVSVYADSIEHINAYGEWHSGKKAIKERLIQHHAGSRNMQKTIIIEKIKFIKSDVAVAMVRQSSTVGNMGMFVLSKISGKWLVESFANVEYKLPVKEAKQDEKERN